MQGSQSSPSPPPTPLQLLRPPSLLHEVAICLVPAFPLKQGVGRDHDVEGRLAGGLAGQL